MRKKIFAILAVSMLSACTVNNNADIATPSAENQSSRSEDAVMDENVASIKKWDAANTEETNTPTATENNLTPQYIDESKYEGDELGIVKTLNNLMKAGYEKDVNANNSLITGDMNPIKWEHEFKTLILSFEKIDFTVKPDLTPPEGAKPVWVEYTESVYGQEPESDKQLFVFWFEDDIWKLLYITDHWQW
ncbi:hypothetical protein [Paenibacillus sp. FSL W7-1287]|uniref:hypothetical protein n=1 Tax=Paenibacillus sp. FSL W7-1287 TaxID=2954538 RepID=UPI0030F61E8D